MSQKPDGRDVHWQPALAPGTGAVPTTERIPPPGCHTLRRPFSATTSPYRYRPLAQSFSCTAVPCGTTGAAPAGGGPCCAVQSPRAHPALPPPPIPSHTHPCVADCPCPSQPRYGPCASAFPPVASARWPHALQRAPGSTGSEKREPRKPSLLGGHVTTDLRKVRQAAAAMAGDRSPVRCRPSPPTHPPIDPWTARWPQRWQVPSIPDGRVQARNHSGAADPGV